MDFQSRTDSKANINSEFDHSNPNGIIKLHFDSPLTTVKILNKMMSGHSNERVLEANFS